MVMQFSQPLDLPADVLGWTITDDGGGTFTPSSVAFGDDNTVLEYTGTWSPDFPDRTQDVVTVAYDALVGSLVGVAGAPVVTFSIKAEYNVLFPEAGYTGFESCAIQMV